MSLSVFVYGNGAREEAIRDSVSKSPLFDKFAGKMEEADLVIFGPEQPICDGLVDELKLKGIKSIGVDKKFSQLESSKLFAKSFMKKYGINHPKVLDIVENYPAVLKNDGLCQGKGVKIIYANAPALEDNCFFEEYLDGEEVSIMSLFDGKTLLNFVPARDFKRLSADKNSSNTGGMGSYCPVDLTQDQQTKLDDYLIKLENALISEKADFVGFIYSGLIWARDDWYVLEYNVRLGDPEAQAISTHLKSDFLQVLVSALGGKLSEVKLEYQEGYSACLVIATEGYPESPMLAGSIEIPEKSNIKVYKAGTKGRVLSLCTNSPDPFPILKDFADKIVMDNKYYREDINLT